MIVRDSAVDTQRRPATGDYWQHANGPYRVVGMANDYPEPKGKYPVTVVYENQTGKLFAGELNDWHRRMIFLGTTPPEGTRWKPMLIRLFTREDD